MDQLSGQTLMQIKSLGAVDEGSEKRQAWLVSAGANAKGGACASESQRSGGRQRLNSFSEVRIQIELRLPGNAAHVRF
jgi:hypothetical protein